MSNLLKTWENLRISYQSRYARYARKYKENPDNKETLGHLLECSYVLINIFGLTSKQVEELELNDFAGLTNKDMED